MPRWSEILAELNQTTNPNYDGVRRKYLASLYQYTNRNVILYASGWIQKETPPFLSSITDEDIHALMEVTHGLRGNLDLILHSPGGSPDAAEAMVAYLRTRFDNIRVLVPHQAMSAATMIACAANEIVLGEHSFLGPTDPQILLPTPIGNRSVPAQAVLDQFDKVKQGVSSSQNISVWLPLISQCGPDLLVRCESALRLSKELVTTWLSTYMFKDDSNSQQKARRVSEWLANNKKFKSHGRHISRSDLLEYGLRINSLEKDKDLEDLSLSVFHATTHTFTGTPAVKIVENHTGRAFIKHHFPKPIKTSSKK